MADYSLHQARRMIKSRRWKPGSWQSVAVEEPWVTTMSPADGVWIRAGYFSGLEAEGELLASLETGRNQPELGARLNVVAHAHTPTI